MISIAEIEMNDQKMKAQIAPKFDWPSLKEISDVCRDAARTLAPIFELHNWQWAGVGVPDQFDIYDSLMKRIEYMKSEPDAWSTSSGRISLIKHGKTVKIMLDVESLHDV